MSRPTDTRTPGRNRAAHPAGTTPRRSKHDPGASRGRHPSAGTGTKRPPGDRSSTFVGLLAGPIARRLNAGRSSLPLAALVGAGVVLGADLLGDARWPWGPLPVGIITGLLGAPMLVALLLRSTSEEEIHG